MPTPINCLRHNPGVGSTLFISSTPKAATARARQKSTQSKSAMYLRLKLNIKLNVAPWLQSPEFGVLIQERRVRLSTPDPVLRLPGHYFQPLFLQAYQ